MTDDHDDEEVTPVQSPYAKKSSGRWKFNLGGVLCGRKSPIVCTCRRDRHEIDERGVARKCKDCGCEHFVVGGMTVDEQRADTERELAAVRPEDDEKKKP